MNDLSEVTDVVAGVEENMVNRFMTRATLKDILRFARTEKVPKEDKVIEPSEDSEKKTQK